MDEILYLETDEEITSVIDKLRDLPGDSVGLVLPKHASLAASVVNLRLLQREAKELKKQIAIITQDKIGTKLALQVGIPVYASVSDKQPVVAETGPRPQVDDVIEFDETSDSSAGEAGSTPVSALESPVPVKRYDESSLPKAVPQAPAIVPPPQRPPIRAQRPQPSPDSTRRRALWVGIGITSLVLALAWLFLWYPRSTITLGLKTESFEHQAAITVDNSLNASNDEKTGIPGSTLESQIEAKQTFDASGKKDVGTKAGGTVTVSNGLGEAVTLPAGSRFDRDGLGFVSGTEVVVPRATADVDLAGNPVVTPGKVDLALEATVAGDQYNLAAGSFTITSLTGQRREKVTASNGAAFSGGTTKTVPVIADTDLEQARTKLIEQSTEQLRNDIRAKAKDLTVLDDALSVSIASSSSSKNVGDEAENFELSATVQAKTIAFAAQDYQEAVVHQALQALPAGKALLQSGADSVETRVENVDIAQGKLTINGVLKTRMSQQIDQEALKQLVTGLTPTAAEEALRQQEGVTTATVALRPWFRKTIPTQFSQIYFVLEQE